MVSPAGDVVQIHVPALGLVVPQVGPRSFCGALAESVGQRRLSMAGQARDSDHLAPPAPPVEQKVVDDGARGGFVGDLHLSTAQTTGSGPASSAQTRPGPLLWLRHLGP